MHIARLFKACRGMSLVELMVVMLIIAILGIVGVPSYRGYMERAQRTEAKDALLRLANNQERFYLQNNTYTADVTQLGFAPAVSQSMAPMSSASRLLTNNNSPAELFLRVPAAWPVICAVGFEIDQAGIKDAAHAGCW